MHQVLFITLLQANGTEEIYLKTFTKCAQLMLAIQEAPVPVIAVVNGIAAAAGCQLAASCDIVVASHQSSFLTPGYDLILILTILSCTDQHLTVGPISEYSVPHLE